MTLGTAVATFALVALALTLTPGLDSALVLRSALTKGRREAAATGAGIIAGLFVWGAAAAVGVSALLTASHLAYELLRFVGAAYLVWFGVRLLLRALRLQPLEHRVDLVDRVLRVVDVHAVQRDVRLIATCARHVAFLRDARL